MRRNPAASNRISGSIRKRFGSALLDVVVASIITAMVLVPTVNIIRRSRTVHDRVQLRQEMTTRCSSLLEQHLAGLDRSFRPRRAVGQFTYNSSRLRYQVVCSDDSAFGGIRRRLMGISVVVWHDKNRNRRMDQDEARVMLYSKTASPGSGSAVAATPSDRKGTVTG